MVKIYNKKGQKMIVIWHSYEFLAQINRGSLIPLLEFLPLGNKIIDETVYLLPVMLADITE